ncbi:SIS domain-containing protein [Actinobacillus porcinus]|uniref:GmhA protein n=1 Tax=Actinobacillus porcinus TaxID=51048 RepID=A0ABY6TL43_9PAST|nr:SIS domain-containing protein [Actinobacillus porcinus]MCI5764534.1 SIS domain-containing protein [Actinobacillus porcinus]MDD7545915.1 SIS domain-containing protein [Actinobacillus porcinus]MDY5421737.1 SIS domain-containing protein [Actinobacillus porcinus]MDY5849203.1 SIS domain-containing protein [Actinobacillus porcinus]MDY6215842.1 SIS domain-containing protein [Actinobacillus porcinus]
MLDKIKDLYNENIQTQIAASRTLPEQLQKAVHAIVAALLRGNKIIVCGHGRSYANAQILVANLLNRYDLERPSFPSVLLNLDSAVGAAIISDQHLTALYQRQFNAVAQQGDILVVMSPFANDEPILDVVNCATTKDVSIIALTGATNDYYQGILTENDIEIQAPSQKESHILESHLFIINALCELIDHSLFGQQ